MPVQIHDFAKKFLPYTSLQVWFLPVLLLLLLPAWVSAQITGRVVDTAGNTLEGVDITALRNGANTVSDAEGNFSLELLDDPVGIRGREILERNTSEVQGTRLQMNLQSGQMEVHAQGDVFDLQGKFLRVVQDAGVYSHGEKGALRRELAQADTLVFVKAGYVTARIEITDDAEDLGDVELEETIGSFTDSRDGQVYRTTTIGAQTWMAENLNYSGDDGAGNKTYETGWCFGVGGTDTTNHADSTTCDTYGRLYTWDMVMDGAASSDSAGPGPQGICPAGWHVPSDGEWAELTDTVIAHTAGTSTDDIAPYLKSVDGWDNNGNGTDDFGFSALPGGYRYGNGSFVSRGYRGYWWSATEGNSDNAWYRYVYYNDEYVVRGNNDKDDGYSLRCLQD